MVLWGLAVLAAFVVVAALVAAGSWKAWRRFELWRDHRRIEANCRPATAGRQQQITLHCSDVCTALPCCAACCMWL